MLISVVAKPNSSLDKIEVKEEVFHVKLKAKPVDGEANDYLVKFLSKTFRIPQSKIEIKKGHTSRNKIINLDIPLEEFENIRNQLMR